MANLKEANLLDLLQHDAKSTYNQWVDTLKLLREITDPSARKMMEEELKELYQKAYDLRWTNQLEDMPRSMMNIVLSRTAEQWIILNRNPRSPIISTN